MKEWISKLAVASGPSGSEAHVRDILAELIQPFADEWHVDVLGNLIAFKKGIANTGKTVMLSANMDEPGIMALHAETNGFIRIVPIGDISPAGLIGERVRFVNRVWGVVGVEAGKSLKDVTFADLFVDIGAESQDDAASLIPVGTAGVIDRGAFELGEFRFAGKALSSRVGCAIVVDVLQKLDAYPHDLQIVFSVQKEPGSRGIKPAVFQLAADFALTVGTAKAGDTPKAERSNLLLGKGPAIKIMDRGIVVPPFIKDMLIETAEQHQLPYQLEVSPDQASDAGAILLSRDGIPVGAVSVPVRYLSTPAQVADLRDMEHASRLVLETLRRYQTT